MTFFRPLRKSKNAWIITKRLVKFWNACKIMHSIGVYGDNITRGNKGFIFATV
jgi:hypothetical protein